MSHQWSSKHSPHSLPNPTIPLIRHRVGRKIICQYLDETPHQSYGDLIYETSPDSTRIFFQNVKGLTHSSSIDNYAYYMSTLHSLNVDITGLAETNSAWSHTHIQTDPKQSVRKKFVNHRVSVGHPSLTLATGGLVSYLHGPSTVDSSGLGRWSGKHFAAEKTLFKHNYCVSHLQRQHPNDTNWRHIPP